MKLNTSLLIEHADRHFPGMKIDSAIIRVLSGITIIKSINLTGITRVRKRGNLSPTVYFTAVIGDAFADNRDSSVYDKCGIIT